MTYKNIINQSFDEHYQAIDKVKTTLVEPIEKIGKILAKSLEIGGTLFWCGNGGSASDSQHLAAELVGRFKNNRRALRSVALNTDTSVLTCVANDYCYDDIFSRQIEALARKGDVIIGISTSGNSENVLRAINTAKKMQVTTVGLLGKEGGRALKLAEHVLVVPSGSTARIQEMHILIGHILCEIIEKELELA